jgi:hypothetical protein
MTASTFTAPSNLILFGINRSGSKMLGLGRIYSCQIWNDGTLIRNYIPVVRKSDGKAGLYDKVNNVFYTDAAGGNFIYNT